MEVIMENVKEIEKWVELFKSAATSNARQCVVEMGKTALSSTDYLVFFDLILSHLDGLIEAKNK
jgi:hypothetical protein